MSALAYPPPTPFLVIFGRDQAGKPHASWFDQASAELATKAAGLMNMQAVPVETEALRELAGSLPRGRVFSSGKAFTPFVNGKLYGRLVEVTRDLLGLSHAEAADNPTGEAAEDDVGPDSAMAGEATTPAVDGKPGKVLDPAPGKKAAPSKPIRRSSRIEDVGLGSMVLATTGATEGWFEAEVIGINGTMLTLKWCDYNEPTVVRRRTELGFLPVLPA
ncbi:hypothetical protein LGH83_08685 [Lichenihabitans sp. PAMC28606]|uniref:hypothetical protein n=1 Tax=Lichenihabitans sp. PAMC28606 TaxID=2880932 RepID=UPI001D09FA37|nr:hypothetical protein [Lichenihabitans sp. PAMC28606]UDL96236.1 hypothetical protein LGH83_08685 [Lichenihabitans sp. PAMC28606]